jgi:hypothetical protein
MYGKRLDEYGINISLKVYVKSVLYNLRLMSVCFIIREQFSWSTLMMGYLLALTRKSR